MLYSRFLLVILILRTVVYMRQSQSPNYYFFFPLCALPPVHLLSFQKASVQFSRSVVSDSATPCTAARQASLSITNSRSPAKLMSRLSRWCHPTISSSVVPFSSCLQSFPASGSFPMSQFFASGSQSFGVSASTSVLPMNAQDWSPLGWTGCALAFIVCVHSA